tara:strand:+ start:299 stop:631 length:333 start_codon:yes stop_codon:yes gene_type:complete
MAATLEEMKKWLLRVNSQIRECEEAYQLVCDFYQGFIESLESFESLADTQAAEKEAIRPVLVVLHSGFSTCCMWVESRHCMGHFARLSKTVKTSAKNLKALSGSKPPKNV